MNPFQRLRLRGCKPGRTRAFKTPYLADKCNLLETNVKGATVEFPTSRRAGYTRPLETSDLKKMAGKKSAETVTGRVVAHPDGYGFVSAEDPPLEQDVFVPPNKAGSAVDGDTVRVRLVPSRRPQRRKGQSSLEGEIFAIVSRGRETIVGKLFRYRQGIYVAPLDERYRYTVRLIDEQAQKIEDGMIVVVSIVVQPGPNQRPQGKIREVLGDPDDPEIQYKIVCHTYEIPVEFPKEVLQEAELAEEPDEKSIQDRRDFRKLLTVTIDGESSRDFDDAISIERLRNGHFRLWFHIADVSHYVRTDTPLDREDVIAPGPYICRFQPSDWCQWIAVLRARRPAGRQSAAQSKPGQMGGLDRFPFPSCRIRAQNPYCPVGPSGYRTGSVRERHLAKGPC